MTGSSGAGSSGVVRRLALLVGALALASSAGVVSSPAGAQAPQTPAAQAAPRAATTPAARKAFQREALASAGARLEPVLAAEANAPGRSAAQARREGEAQVQAGHASAALPLLAAAVTADPADPQNWLAYARAADILGNDEKAGTYSDRFRRRQAALAAAYQAYLRAATPQAEARALAFLGEAQARQSDWRPALEAYRASLALDDRDSVRETYEDLREEHGFRILDYKVDADAAAPRA